MPGESYRSRSDLCCCLCVTSFKRLAKPAHRCSLGAVAHFAWYCWEKDRRSILYVVPLKGGSLTVASRFAQDGPVSFFVTNPPSHAKGVRFAGSLDPNTN